MFNLEFLKEKKNQLMIADKKFNPKEVQNIIDIALSKGEIIEKNENNNFIKYYLNYEGNYIIGENYIKQKHNLFANENRAFTRFRTLDFFNKRAIESQKPIMAFVNYSKDNTSNGWFFYHYKEYTPCKQVNFVQVIDVINDIHAKGMIIKNPSIKNFGFDGTRVIIDGDIKKNYYGVIGKYLNFVDMKNSSFIFEKIYPFKNNPLYKFISKIRELFDYSKDIPEFSINYFKESKEELHKIKTKIKSSTAKDESITKIDNIKFEDKQKNIE